LEIVSVSLAYLVMKLVEVNSRTSLINLT